MSLELKELPTPLDPGYFNFRHQPCESDLVFGTGCQSELHILQPDASIADMVLQDMSGSIPADTTQASSRLLDSMEFPMDDISNGANTATLADEVLPCLIEEPQTSKLASEVTSAQNNDRLIGGQSQHRMGQALQLLQGLFNHPTPFLLAGKATPSTMPTCAIEQVIAKNKEAMAAMHRILDCPCSLDINMAFTLTTLVSKIISWYHAASQLHKNGMEHVSI